VVEIECRWPGRKPGHFCERAMTNETGDKGVPKGIAMLLEGSEARDLYISKI
jgi:hypothetical protein